MQSEKAKLDVFKERLSSDLAEETEINNSLKDYLLKEKFESESASSNARKKEEIEDMKGRM